MVAPKKKPVKTAKAKKPEPFPVYASETQIKEFQRDIKELEIMLAEDRQRKQPKITDPDGVKAEILKKQQYIERHSPPKLRGDNANKAYKEAKQLEKIIKENMPKSSAFNQQYPKGSDSYNKQQKFEEAVKQQMRFMSNPKVKQAVLKYKYIMARLSGNDPSERNIEKLRANR